MTPANLSRRQFGRRLGGGLSAAFVANELFRGVAHARQPKGVPEGVIQLNSNENPYGPSKRAQRAISGARKIAARYPDALETEVIETIARLHSVAPEQVILGCGSGEVLRMADMAFLAPGQYVVVANPTFEAVLAYARVTRAEPVQVPQTADFRHDLPAMAAACNLRTGLVYVCNPNNPTGTIVTRAELQTFLDRVPLSVTVLVDEAYHHFVEDPQYASAFAFLEKHPNLVVVRTFSKVYGMAGMRLGYAVAAREKIAAMRQHLIWNNGNAAVLEAALASLADADHVPKHRRMNNDLRRWLCAELERDARRYIPSHTNFVMIHLGRDVGPVIDAFRSRNILVGRRFPSMDQWMRISIGTEKEMKAFLAALRQIVPVSGGQSASLAPDSRRAA